MDTIGKIIALLLALWLVGMLTSYTVGGLVWLLLYVGVLLILVRVIQGTPITG